jgi:hypothetical protein
MVVLSSKMRRVQFKRGRIVRIAACVFIVVPLLYLLFSKSNQLQYEASLNRKSLSEPDKYIIRSVSTFISLIIDCQTVLTWRGGALLRFLI